jgi:hypothetical protein
MLLGCPGPYEQERNCFGTAPVPPRAEQCFCVPPGLDHGAGRVGSRPLWIRLWMFTWAGGSSGAAASSRASGTPNSAPSGVTGSSFGDGVRCALLPRSAVDVRHAPRTPGWDRRRWCCTTCRPCTSRLMPPTGFREPGFCKERRQDPQITVGLPTDQAGFPLMVRRSRRTRPTLSRCCPRSGPSCTPTSWRTSRSWPTPA